MALGDDARRHGRPTPPPRCGRRAGSGRSGVRPQCDRPRRQPAASAARSAASLDHAQRPDHVDRPAVLGARQVRQQLDQEAGPHLIADRDATGARDHRCGERDRIVGLVPRDEAEHTGLWLDARGLEPGDQQRGVAVARHDEQRQPFERHGVVAGEVRQVVADGEQDDVEALLVHRGPDPVESVEIDLAHPAERNARDLARPVRSPGIIRPSAGAGGRVRRARRTPADP